MCGQLVHHQERRAVARHHGEDRAFPGQHVRVEVGRKLEEVGRREDDGVNRQLIHQRRHFVQSILPDSLGKFGHGVSL
ncbi:hypothetical protein D3C85_1731840 [compost metagenome]